MFQNALTLQDLKKLQREPPKAGLRNKLGQGAELIGNDFYLTVAAAN
jgi:hypothetical protein